MNRPRLSTFLSAAALTISLAFAACSTANSTGSPSGTASDSAGASGSASATGTLAASDSAEPDESLPAFACNLPVHLASTTSRAQITDIGVETRPTFDRLTLTFAAGLPEVTLEKARPPLTQDPSGLPVAVQGSSFLRLVLHGGTTQLPSGGSSYSGMTSFTPRYPRLVDVQAAGDFEAVASWYLGLTGDACVRVFTSSAPDRLVIDVQH